jgi:hypothetical protein
LRQGAVADKISKLGGARRQIETAIELFFNNKDSLSVHTLAWAGFKVLFDLYPHRNSDGFAAKLDSLISKEGWKFLAGIANFLKHADKDPDVVLESHHPMVGMAIIGLATLLYRRVAGEFTLKMTAFDFWTDELADEECGLPEVDDNKERAAQSKVIRDRIRNLPFEEQIVVGRKAHHSFMELYEPAKQMVAQGEAQGLTPTQLLDRLTPPSGRP